MVFVLNAHCHIAKPHILTPDPTQSRPRIHPPRIHPACPGQNLRRIHSEFIRTRSHSAWALPGDTRGRPWGSPWGSPWGRLQSDPPPGTRGRPWGSPGVSPPGPWGGFWGGPWGSRGQGVMTCHGSSGPPSCVVIFGGMSRPGHADDPRPDDQGSAQAAPNSEFMQNTFRIQPDSTQQFQIQSTSIIHPLGESPRGVPGGNFCDFLFLVFDSFLVGFGGNGTPGSVLVRTFVNSCSFFEPVPNLPLNLCVD